MSKTEITPKIFLEPREKRSEQALPLNLNKNMIIDQLSIDNTASSSTKAKPRCVARVATGSQCGRTRKEGHDYCGCHVKHRPYGRFDGPIEGKKFLGVPKKRGPRFKNAKEYTLDQLDQDLYIQTQLVKIDDQCFLIDKHGVLFTNDNKGEIVGRREGEYITWFV